MRLLYSLLFIIFINSSLYAVWVFDRTDRDEIKFSTSNCYDYYEELFPNATTKIIVSETVVETFDTGYCNKHYKDDYYYWVECEEVPPPDDLISLKVYSGSGSMDQCYDDLQQIDQNTTTATCYIPQCATDADVTLYVSSEYANQDGDSNGDGIPNKCDPNYPAYDDLDCDGDGTPNSTDDDIDDDGIPNETDSDNTSPGGGDTTELTPEQQEQQDCENQKQTFRDYGYYITVHTDFEVGFQDQYNFGYGRKIAEYPECFFDVFEVVPCPKMYKYDTNLAKCVKTDDTKEADSECTTQYNRTDYVDLSQISFDYRMIDYDLQPFKCYVEYSCTADYRIKKFEEVSCSDNLNTNELYVKTDSNSSTIVTSEFERDFSDWDQKTDSEQQEILDRISSESSLDGTLDGINTENLESGLSDINSTLGSLKNQFDGKNPDGTDIDNTDQINSFNQLDGVLTTINDGFSSIGQDYQNMVNRIDQGLSYSAPRSGSQAPLTATVFNKQIDFDLCSSFSAVSNIFYYIFTMVFLYLAIKLYWYGFLISLRD
jgi:hypothetical protein